MGRKRVVDDDDVEAPPGHPGIERGGVATSALRGLEVHRASPIRAQPRLGEDFGIPIRSDETQRPEGEIARETLAMRDNRDAKPWIPAQKPGREHDGGQDRFQVTRRQVDDETAIAFGRDVVQSFGQELDIIDDEQPITRIDVAKGALEKGEKVRTEQRAERVPIVVRIGHDDCPGLGAREPTQAQCIAAYLRAFRRARKRSRMARSSPVTSSPGEAVSASSGAMTLATSCSTIAAARVSPLSAFASSAFRSARCFETRRLR